MDKYNNIIEALEDYYEKKIGKRQKVIALMTEIMIFKRQAEYLDNLNKVLSSFGYADYRIQDQKFCMKAVDFAISKRDNGYYFMWLPILEEAK